MLSGTGASSSLRIMGRVDDALLTLRGMPLGTERALQLAGLISTLFKINGVGLVTTGQLAFHGYADTRFDQPEIAFAPLTGSLPPRTVLEVMRGQIHAKGSIYEWHVGRIPVRFHDSANIAHRELCRDFTTHHGVVKLVPVEEITADYILASVYPSHDAGAYVRAHRLLFNGLSETFEMNWPVLSTLCHRPEYRVGEELAQMRLEAKKDVDAQGKGPDHIGDTGQMPTIRKAHDGGEEVPSSLRSKAEKAASDNPYTG